MTAQNTNTSRGGAGAVMIAGFLGTIGALVGWFVTHLPMIGLSEAAAVWGMRAVWLLALAGGLAWCRVGRGRPAWGPGLGSGLMSGVLGAALIGGTKGDGASTGALVAAAGWFVATGAVLGLLAGVVAGLGARAGAAGREGARLSQLGLVEPERNRSRFALVTGAAIAPLIFIGGLVTSTDSGMAVPDWPSTFGANMLAYPLNNRSPGDVFLEHSHRLFGMLVGFTAIALVAWAVVGGVRGWALKLTIGALVLIGVQGVLGGLRVTENSRLLALAHGALAQGVFAVVIALAAYLSPSYRRTDGLSEIDPVRARRVKMFATALLHALILQLLLGALTRHFRTGNHALWTHAAFSLVVMIVAAMAGAAAASLPAAGGARGLMALRSCGRALNIVVGIQFLLGWAAFAVRGRTIKADDALEALVRTAHQANGAVLLGLAACTFVWARWLWRAVRPEGAGWVVTGSGRTSPLPGAA